MTEMYPETEFSLKFKGMLSLAMKAHKLEVGESRAQTAVRGDSAYLLVVSADASANTKKKFADMAAYRNVPIVFTGDRDELGRAVGRNFAVTAAVTDKGFADGMLKIIGG